MKSEYRRLARQADQTLLELAIEIADDSVLCTLSNTCGFPTADGWRECHYHREAHEKMALNYAARRGLIERHPTNKALYKVTAIGSAVRGDEGPSLESAERGRKLLASGAPLTVFESRDGRRVEVPWDPSKFGKGSVRG